MRFCPFCAAENADEATHCATCARRLPALPARKAAAPKGGAAAGVAVPAAPAAPAAPATAAVAPAPAPPLPKPAPAPTVPQEFRPGPAAEKRVRDGHPPAAAPEIPPPPPAVAPTSPRALTPSDAAPTAIPPEHSGPATVITAPPTPSASHKPDDELPSAHVGAMPEVPEAGVFAYARYAILFARARWARTGAIKKLEVQIKEHVAILDGVLGNLGRAARAAKLEGRAFTEENRAIDAAERRRADAEKSCGELTTKKSDENTRYEAIHRDLSEKLQVKEQEAGAAASALEKLEAERKGVRERRKEVERQQRAYAKAADERDEQAQKSGMGDTRQQLKRAAADLRSDAARLQPEKEDLERRLADLEVPLRDAHARNQQARSEHDAARRALEDAREGHRHRLAELEAELSHKSRELQQAEAEIARRLVTLGTLVNLHRLDRAEFATHYAEVDRLRAAIALREREIDRLNAERYAYDRASVVRGIAVLAGALVLIITIICVLIIVL